MTLLFLLSLLIGQVPSISGQIRDIHGVPRPNVRIAIMALDENDKDNTGHVTLTRLRETGNEGRYQLDNVPPGRYLLVAGLAEDPTYYPGVKRKDEAHIVTVVSGQAISNLDFALV